MQVQSKEYQEHKIFDKLSSYIEFYGYFSDLIMSFITMGATGVINIDTYTYSSMKGTLQSMKMLLQMGHINDAYSLMRKFYDAAYINVYTILYLDDNFSFDNLVVKQIQNWLHGTETLPSFRSISDYIRKHQKLEELNSLLYTDNRYTNLRERCNDNTHYNFYKNILLNDAKIFNKDRKKALEDFSNDITDLVIMHLSYVFFLNQHYLSSSDFRDYFDIGETPPKNSQLWVAPFIQDIFDNLFKVQRSDIANLIKSNTDMHLK